MKPPDPMKVREIERFECPFCGKECSVGYGYPGKIPIVLHAMPPCNRYLVDETPADFIAAVNEALRR